jgi:Carboxypeptidase regulatory-like domain
MNRIQFALRLGFMALVACVLGQAQTGSIQGTVTDKSGAIVQDADVVVTSLNTNQTRAAKSGDAGTYSVPSLAAGPYSISITKDGFRAFKVDSVTLTVDQSLTLNASLEPGAASEEVQVRGDEIPPVDLQTAQVSNMVEGRQMQNLPLITRDPYSLVLLSPGTSQTNTSLGGFTVNGSRERNNNFLLDGVDNNDTSVPGIPGGVLSANPDSTQEFRVITSNFNAEYGRNTGAIIDVVTKSGTNSFHGGAYWFGRWNSFGGARDWFNPRVDTAGNINPMNPYVRNQFGYSIGGPIVKNKTFFFFNQEFQRFRTTLTNSATVPTPEFKTGIFNYTNAGVTVPVDITQTGANNGTPTILQQFGVPVVLPPAPADPTMQNLLALYPNPTFSNGDGITGTLTFPSGSRQNSYQAVAKIDHQFTSRQNLSLRYGYNYIFDPNPFHDDALPGGVGGTGLKGISQGASAHLASTFTNTVVNSLNVGWNRIFASFNCNGTSVLNSVVPVDRFGNGWDVNMDPFTSFGCLSLVSAGQWRKTGTTSYGDALTWVKGNHILKFGFDYRDIHQEGPNSFFSRRQVSLLPFLDFDLSLVQNVPNDSSALQDAAGAYYGFVAQDFVGQFFDKAGTRQATDNKLFRQHEYNWFGQDDWKIKQNLTLTLGLRYQLDGVPYEENANMSNLLVPPTTLAPLTMSIVGPGTGNQLYKNDHSNIEPRIGLSWDPWGDGQTAIRGAFGIFHDRVFGNLFGNARGNPPFEQDYNAFPLDTINGFYGGGINGPFYLPAAPEQTPSAVIPNYDPVTNVGALSPVLFDVNFRNASSNNWNFGIQRQLPGMNVLDISYIGSEAHHLYRQVDGNPPNPALVQQLVTYCSDPNNAFGCDSGTVTKNNLYIGAEVGALPFDAVASNALFQPPYQRSIGNSIYHSLQTKFTHRMSHGLQAQVSYTWAHGIDNAPDPLAPAQGNRAFPRNSVNLNEERGNSDYDVRHIAVINYIWQMPFGKGKGILNQGAIGKIFEGWQFSGITTVQTGHPFDVFTTTDMERTGLSGRADLVSGQDPYSAGLNTPSSANGNKVWISNPAAFSNRSDVFGGPLYVGSGTSGRNRFYGPGLVDFDLAWEKTTSITERVSTQLRVECYNLFNHPHFSNPDNFLESPTFGLISGTVSRPDATTSARQMQVALKVTF